MTERERQELARQEAIARYVGPQNRMVQFGHDRWHADRAFIRKVSRALDTVRAALRSIRRPKPYIAFSGGKDSTVVAALVRRCRRKTLMAWSDDELEYPETVALMKRCEAETPTDFERLRGTGPHADWFYPWEPPGLIRQPMGLLMMPTVHQWEADLGYNVVFLGTRSSESTKRREWLTGHGPIYRVKGGLVRCCPIWDWTDNDVWTLIAGWHLTYNAAYDRFDQLGIDGGQWRVGPLPLVPRSTLAAGWPKLLGVLESHYGPRWN